MLRSMPLVPPSDYFCGGCHLEATIGSHVLETVRNDDSALFIRPSCYITIIVPRERNTARVRAGLRAVIPAVLTLVLVIGWSRGLTPAIVPDGSAAARRAFATVVQFPGYLLAIGLALWTASRLDRRRYSEFGLAVDRSWLRNFVVGTGISLGALALSILYARVRGVVAVDAAGVEADSTASIALLVGGVSLFVAFTLLQNVYEEVVYRGIVLQNFAEGLAARGWSPRAAVLLATVGSCAAFGAFHLPLGGPLVAVDAALVGVSFALAYLLTGNLGLAIGLHFGRTPLNILVEPGAEATEPFGLPPIIELTAPAPDVELLRLGTTGALLLGWASYRYGELRIAETISRPAHGRTGE